MKSWTWIGFVVSSLFFLAGCDLFVSRGGEGQPCFSENEEKPCSGDLVCETGTCRAETADGGDGGDGFEENCRDLDNDGYLDNDPTLCPSGTDLCDWDSDNWTSIGCANCEDNDEDGYGINCDRGIDCDEGNPDVHQGCLLTNIYRSVGPGSGGPLVTPAGNSLSVTSTTATFQSPLPDHIGVGDTILYDIDGLESYDSQVFIQERTGPNTFEVVNASGGPAVAADPTTNWGIYRAYTSLAEAIALEENAELPVEFGDFDSEESKELISRNRVWHIACYADGLDEGGAVSIVHWNGDEDRYLHIFTPHETNHVGVRQRHLGSWNSNPASAYTINYLCNDLASETVIEVGQYSAVHIEGLQVVYDASQQTTSGSCSGISVVGGPVSWISHNIVKGENTNRSPAVLHESPESLLNMWNNVVFTNDSIPGGVGIELGRDVHAFIYNNTVCNWRRGFNSQWNLGQSVVLKNNLAVNNFDREYPDGGYDFKAEIAFSELSSHNCSSDETAVTVAPQGPSCNGVTMDEFVNPGEGDFHLDLATIEGFGVDLSQDTDLPFTSDIDADNVRPMGDGWDVGADELDE